MFVVRDTNHPEEDLKRNWSAAIGGFDHESLFGCSFSSIEEIRNKYKEVFGEDCRMPEFRYHPAHESFVPVHYEGLGAWKLDSDSVEEALNEAASFDDYLACTSEAGDGRFEASDCLGFYKVREGKYIFEIK